MSVETCWSCAAPIVRPEGSIGTGYAIVPGLEGAEHKICYACAADRESREMVATGRATLYLTDREVTNWTGRVCFITPQRWSAYHPFGRMTCVRFMGPDGAVWTGRHIGENTQLVHCRRTKLRSLLG